MLCCSVEFEISAHQLHLAQRNYSNYHSVRRKYSNYILNFQQALSDCFIWKFVWIYILRYCLYEVADVNIFYFCTILIELKGRVNFVCVEVTENLNKILITIRVYIINTRIIILIVIIFNKIYDKNSWVVKCWNTQTGAVWKIKQFHIQEISQPITHFQ